MKCVMTQFSAYTDLYEIEMAQKKEGRDGQLPFPSSLHCKKMWRNNFYMRYKCQAEVEDRNQKRVDLENAKRLSSDNPWPLTSDEDLLTESVPEKVQKETEMRRLLRSYGLN